MRPGGRAAIMLAGMADRCGSGGGVVHSQETGIAAAGQSRRRWAGTDVARVWSNKSQPEWAAHLVLMKTAQLI